MTSLYWVQVLTALVSAANVLFWGRVALRESGFLRIIALPPLTWCDQALLFFAALFAFRILDGGVLAYERSLFFNWWSSAVRLHGALACLPLFYFMHDWRRANGRG